MSNVSGIIKSIQFTDGGSELASISRQTDSSVYFLDPDTGAVTRRFQQHELCGAAVAVSDNGRYLATTSDDASVRIWKLEPVGTSGMNNTLPQHGSGSKNASSAHPAAE